MLNKNAIKTMLESAEGFPALPAITQQILNLLKDPDVSFISLSLIIEKDASFSSGILRLVNSSYYGVKREIKNINEAVSLLGVDEIQKIALGISLFNVFPKDKISLFENIFQQSLCSAVASDLIAETFNFKNRCDIFISGLLQYIGKLSLMYFMPDDYLTVLNDAKKSNVDLTLVEKEKFGITNIEAGIIICEQWKLPDIVKYCILYRENLSGAHKAELSESQVQIIKASYLGSIASEIYFGFNKAINILRFKTTLSKLQLANEEESEKILCRIPNILKDAGGEFLLKIDQKLSYEQILKEIGIDSI